MQLELAAANKTEEYARDSGRGDLSACVGQQTAFCDLGRPCRRRVHRYQRMNISIVCISHFYNLSGAHSIRAATLSVRSRRSFTASLINASLAAQFIYDAYRSTVVTYDDPSFVRYQSKV